MNRIIKYSTLVVAMLLLTSCNIYKKYELPQDNEVVARFSQQAQAVPDSSALPYLGWKQVFTDPQLQTLIQRALDSNTNLKNAKLNIDIAHAQLKGAKLSYFPSLAFNPNASTASYGGSHMNWGYQLPLAAQWEIDVFGKILNRKRQAQMGLEQAEYYEEAVRSQIICGVANTYYSIVLLKQQLALTERTAAIWADQVKTMKLMKEAGSTNEAAVMQSSANYNNLMSTIPDLKAQIRLLQNTLSLLLHTYPQEWATTSELNFDLPESIVGGIPMAAVANRPDVWAAEREFARAFYATNSARAAFYPSLTISGTGGFTNILGSLISNPGKWFIQLAGSLVAPIFSRGQNIAGLEMAKAQQQQALNNFEYALLSAGADVDDALVKIKQNDEKRVYVMRQVEDLEKAVEYTNTLFSVSKSSYLEVLTARSSLLNAQMASLSCWHDRVAALISLYQAVGGGR